MANAWVPFTFQGGLLFLLWTLPALAQVTPTPTVGRSMNTLSEAPKRIDNTLTGIAPDSLHFRCTDVLGIMADREVSQFENATSLTERAFPKLKAKFGKAFEDLKDFYPSSTGKTLYMHGNDGQLWLYLSEKDEIREIKGIPGEFKVSPFGDHFVAMERLEPGSDKAKLKPTYGKEDTPNQLRILDENGNELKKMNLRWLYKDQYYLMTKNGFDGPHTRSQEYKAPDIRYAEFTPGGSHLFVRFQNGTWRAVDMENPEKTYELAEGDQKKGGFHLFQEKKEISFSGPYALVQGKDKYGETRLVALDLRTNKKHWIGQYSNLLAPVFNPATGRAEAPIVEEVDKEGNRRVRRKEKRSERRAHISPRGVAVIWDKHEEGFEVRDLRYPNGHKLAKRKYHHAKKSSSYRGDGNGKWVPHDQQTFPHEEKVTDLIWLDDHHFFVASQAFESGDERRAHWPWSTRPPDLHLLKQRVYHIDDMEKPVLELPPIEVEKNASFGRYRAPVTQEIVKKSDRFEVWRLVYERTLEPITTEKFAPRMLMRTIPIKEMTKRRPDRPKLQYFRTPPAPGQWRRDFASPSRPEF